MAVTLWSFLRPHPGGLCPVAQRALDEFLSDARRLPADAEGFVRYAQVIVNLENRCAVEVLRVGFFQYRVLRDGRLDREHFHQIMAAVPEAAFGWLQLSKPLAGVVAAVAMLVGAFAIMRRITAEARWRPVGTACRLNLLKP